MPELAIGIQQVGSGYFQKIRRGWVKSGHLWHSCHMLLSPAPVLKVEVRKSYQDPVNQEHHHFPQRDGLDSK